MPLLTAQRHFLLMRLRHEPLYFADSYADTSPILSFQPMMITPADYSLSHRWQLQPEMAGFQAGCTQPLTAGI